LVSFKSIAKLVQRAIAKTSRLGQNLWNWSFKQGHPLPSSELTNLEYDLLTKAPIAPSQLDKAVLAAGEIHCVQHRGADSDTENLQPRSNKWGVAVYVSAAYRPLPPGIVKILEHCSHPIHID